MKNSHLQFPTQNERNTLNTTKEVEENTLRLIQSFLATQFIVITNYSENNSRNNPRHSHFKYTVIFYTIPTYRRTGPYTNTASPVIIVTSGTVIPSASTTTNVVFFRLTLYRDAGYCTFGTDDTVNLYT